MAWRAPKRPKKPSTMTEIDMPRMQQKAPGLGESGSLHMMASRVQEGCKQAKARDAHARLMMD